MKAMLFVIALASFGGAVFLLLEELWRPRRELRRSLVRAGGYGRRGAPAAADTTEVESPRRLAALSEPAARIALRLTPRTTLDAVELRLASAGLAGRLSANELLALKLALCGGCAVLGFAAGVSLNGAALAVFLLLAGAAAGFLLPDWLLRARVRARQEEIRAALPNALDLLAVTVEAGLGLPAAMARLTEISKGPLADEFALALGQMSVGESRAEALRKLADRAGVVELSTFVRAVVQADHLGVALGRTLRLQAAETRSRRQLAAEERAQKAPVKMLFPTALFIFPTLFVVVLGPALMSIMKIFH